MKIIHTVDSHTAGEGTRLVLSGLPPLLGSSMEEKFVEARQRFPWLPKLLLREPRGHKDLYGALLTSPCTPQADQGVLFMNNSGYEPMCGHGLIGVVTCLLEMGIFPVREPETRLVLDTPAGVIAAYAKTVAGRALSVAFDNVPSFGVHLDALLRLPEGYPLVVDIAFGGNYFVLLDAGQLGIELLPANAGRLADWGMRILEAANQQFEVRHPEIPHIDRITDVRFIAAPDSNRLNSRNVVVLGHQMVDRSPCGTGTCAELAVRFARGQALPGQLFTSQGILGTQFTAQIVEQVQFTSGKVPYPAIRPRLEGQAYLTGFHQFILHDDDPFPEGFLL